MVLGSDFFCFLLCERQNLLYVGLRACGLVSFEKDNNQRGLFIMACVQKLLAGARAAVPRETRRA